MKIVLLVGPNVRHKAFVNIIFQHFNNIIVIEDDKERSKKTFKNVSILKKIKFKIASILFPNEEKKFKKIKSTIEVAFFRKYHEYPGDIKIIKTNVNSNISINTIKNFEPDYIICFGTRLVKKEIFTLSKKLSLNIHTGISPYYRGGHSNLWAILNKDYSNIGSTIHLLDQTIDNGKYLKRIHVKSSGDFFIDNCKTIEITAKELIKILDENKIEFEEKNISQISSIEHYKSNFDLNNLVIKKYLNMYFNE